MIKMYVLHGEAAGWPTNSQQHACPKRPEVIQADLEPGCQKYLSVKALLRRKVKTSQLPPTADNLALCTKARPSSCPIWNPLGGCIAASTYIGKTRHQEERQLLELISSCQKLLVAWCRKSHV